MNRDEWKKYLRQTAEDIRLPESLEPENIEKQLEAGNNRRNQIKAERKAWYRRPALRNTAAAAAIPLPLQAETMENWCCIPGRQCSRRMYWMALRMKPE